MEKGDRKDSELYMDITAFLKVMGNKLFGLETGNISLSSIGESIKEDMAAWKQVTEPVYVKFLKEKVDKMIEFKNRIVSDLMRYKTNVNYNMLNLLSSHDVHRFFTECKKDEDRFILGYAFMFMYIGFHVYIMVMRLALKEVMIQIVEGVSFGMKTNGIKKYMKLSRN